MLISSAKQAVINLQHLFENTITFDKVTHQALNWPIVSHSFWGI